MVFRKGVPRQARDDVDCFYFADAGGRMVSAPTLEVRL